MQSIIKAMLIMLASIILRNAVAVGEHLLVTNDGNIWEVRDELVVGTDYKLVFDTLGNNIAEDDVILRVLEV